MEPITGKLLEEIVTHLEDKKAIDIRVLDMMGLASYTDILVVCSGSSNTHVNAIVRGVSEKLSNPKDLWKVNSSKDGSWWILDFVDVVVHIFQEKTRAFYDLEGLWCDAPRLDPTEISRVPLS